MTQATSLWNSYFQEIIGLNLDSETKIPVIRIVTQKQLRKSNTKDFLHTDHLQPV